MQEIGVTLVMVALQSSDCRANSYIFSEWTTLCTSTANWTRIIYQCEEGLLVSIVNMFPNAVEVTWPRDSEHPCHLSAVDKDPLAGSMRVRGPTTDDSAFCAWLC